MTRRTACGIPALCLVSLLATGAPTLADPIDDYIQHEMTARRIPGLALAVARHGKITKMHGYGLANLEHGVAVTSDTVFELASVGKQFTATAIMVLVEAGKVQLDESILAYLSGGPEAWKAITVRHLLTHTSGLPAMGEGFKSLNAGGARVNYSTRQLFIEQASGQSYRDFLEDRFFKPFGMSSTSVLE